jgi:hypothetical protein
VVSDNLLDGGSGSDSLVGGEGDDLLAGGGDDDDLLGGAGDDRLEGGDGADNLLGDAGDDVLDGGPGNNRLSGDAGADRFIVSDFDVDEILDLNVAEGDVVDFSALAQEALSAGLALGESVRLGAGTFGTTLAVDVGDNNGFQDVALLRGVEPLAQVTSTGELVALARPAAVPLVSLSLAALDGTNGFRLRGIEVPNSVSDAGDVNGDGFADVIVGAPYAALGQPYGPGASYVVFGDPSGFGGVVDVSVLDGGNGFRLDGVDLREHSGFSVSGGGDVNGDGFADLIIGAPYGARLYTGSGESYVVFGNPDGFGGVLDLAALDGSTGFRLDGVDPGSRTGRSVSSAGDVNGDGYDDVIIGAHAATPDGRLYAGESYVVFGDPDGFGGALDLASLDGSHGFRLIGIDAFDLSGESVSGAGDVNGDGLEDVIVSARFADPSGRPDAGESYVVFGDPDGFGGALDLAALDGSNGFRLDGVDFAIWSVSGAGDVNGDGLADLIIGSVNGGYGAGESYVVFADPGGFGGALDLASLNRTNGFRLDGIDPGDSSGYSVSGAGDVNGDGLADLIVGAPGAGESYVVFGDAGGFGGALSLAALDGTNGFRLDGIGGLSGYSVSGAGDVNGDGFADLIVGAPLADPGGRDITGESYVVFGGNFTGAVDGLGDEGDDIFIGSRAGEIFVGAQGDDALIGNGGSDLLNGAAGDDLLAIADTGFSQLAGGSGTDTIRLDGAGGTLDLTAISDLFVQDVERVDLNGSGNELVLNTREVLNIDDNSNTLTVLGEDTNAVDGSLPGAVQGTTTVGGVDFTTFAVGQAQLLVQTGVDTSGIETAAA